MIRYVNIFTRKYRLYQEDFIRWKSYGSLEEARAEASIECPSNYCFKKTVIVDIDNYSGVDFSDEFFEEAFPETHHHYDDDVVYINPA